MSDDDLLAQLDELEAEVSPAEPAPAGEVEELSIHTEPDPPEEERQSGTLILKYTRSLVKRDPDGRIVEIIGEGTRKLVKRDEGGRIVEIIEEEEQEL